jgi:hypothetical protein
LIWRLWKEAGVPLRELREYYTYEDVLKANAVLDMYADTDAALSQYYKPKEKKR